MLRERYGQAALLFLALLLYSATGYMYFEFPGNPDLSWPDAFWWSLVTMTTVGYGDLFPVTFGGRWLVGFPTMGLGIGLLGYILSLIATVMLESKSLEIKGLKKVHCKNHVVICGFGTEERLLKLISEIQTDAATANSETVIVDNTIQELPETVRQSGIYFVYGDSCKDTVLIRANIAMARAVIIQASSEQGTDDRNLKVALAVKAFTPSTFLVAECVHPENESFFRQAKCDSVLCVSTLSEQMLVQELQDPGVSEIVAQLTSNSHGKQFYIVDIDPSHKDYRTARKANSGVERVPVGLQRNGENHLLPVDDFAIEAGDRLILIAAQRPV